MRNKDDGRQALDIEHKTKNEIIKDLATAMADSMADLIQSCIEQRLRQILPLIKEGLTK